MSRLYLVIWIICGYMAYMMFYRLCGLFVVIIHNFIYIFVLNVLSRNYFSNIQWFIFIIKRNLYLINRSPNFRKYSNWNFPKNSNNSKEKCCCM